MGKTFLEFSINTMGEATVNGDMPHSAVLSHLQSYPVVSDSIKTIKENPYGAKSIDITNAGYTKFVERVPIVKSETKEIQDTFVTYLHWPFETANNTKDWAFKTYNDEYKKCGGEGVVAGGKAVVTTGLVMTSDVLKWISSFLQQKKEGAKEVAQDKTGK